MITGAEVKTGMLVRSRLGIRFIVKDVGREWWYVQQARKDWLPDQRFNSWSGHLFPDSEWEVCGWDLSNEKRK